MATAKRIRIGAVILLAAAVGVIGAACSVAGLADGPPPSENPDASPDGGGPEASADAGDATGSACAHSVCEDFEREGGLEQWDFTYANPDLTLDSTEFVSPRHSLLVRCGNSRACRMEKSFSKPAKPEVHVNVELRLRLVTPPQGTESLELFMIRPSSEEGTLMASYKEGTAQLQICSKQGGGCDPTKNLQPPLGDRFQYYKVEATYSGEGADAGVRVNVNGSFFFEGKGATVPSPTLTFSVGDFVMPSGPASAFRVDDVTVDVF